MRNITRLGLFVALGSAVLAACSSLSSGPVTGSSQVGQQVIIDEGNTTLTSTSKGVLDDVTKQKLLTSSRIVHEFSDGKKFLFVNIPEGDVLSDGDIIIGKTKDIPTMVQYYEDHFGKYKSISSQGVGISRSGCSQYFFWGCVKSTSIYFWPNLQIPYTFNSNLGGPDDPRRVKIEAAVNHWNSVSDVKFVPYTTNQVSHVRFDGSTTCAASVGNNSAYSNGSYFAQSIYLTDKCINNKRDILHEMGHTAGLWHEQQRCDRDNYVVVTPNHGQVDYGDTSGISVNWGKQCGADAKMYGNYDFDSVMHYIFGTYTDATNTSMSLKIGATGYSGNPNNVTYSSSYYSLTTLSSGDISALNTMY